MSKGGVCVSPNPPGMGSTQKQGGGVPQPPWQAVSMTRRGSPAPHLLRLLPREGHIEVCEAAILVELGQLFSV